MKIGHTTIPQIRIPAFVKGQLMLLDLATLEGQWAIVCGLPSFDFGDAIFLNQCHRTVHNEGGKLLGLFPFGESFLDTRLPKVKILRIPVLADPLQRLHRVFGLNKDLRLDRCHSFIIDPQRVVRYHLIHQLNWRGLLFLIEILKHCQEQHSSSYEAPMSFRGKGSSSSFSQLQKPTRIRTPMSTIPPHEKEHTLRQ